MNVLVFYCISGFTAFGLFIASISYSILKRIKIANIKINRKKLLDAHCIFAIVGTGVALIHSILNFNEFKLSASYICLFSIMLITITGMILRYVKGVSKYREKLIFFHIVLTFVFVSSAVLHLIGYYLMV